MSAPKPAWELTVGDVFDEKKMGEVQVRDVYLTVLLENGMNIGLHPAEEVDFIRHVEVSKE